MKKIAPCAIGILSSLSFPAATNAQERQLSLPAQLVLGSEAQEDDTRLPLARSTLSADELETSNLGANLSESLQRVPGLVAVNRQNYAQDLQISSRGFGARAAFGVRGVRLVQDGIPLTMPDGQGQPALFDLDSMQRIEVLRGPLTTLYGNASGGIIQGFTGEGSFYPTLENRTAFGPDGLRRSRLRYGGQHGDLNINANVARLDTDGYRDHSKTQRDTANLRLGWDIDDASSLTLLINSLDQPETQDPLGLTAQQVREDRRQSVAGSQTFNTRKTVRHNQAGLNYTRRLSNDDQLTAMIYGGERYVQQYLAFPGGGQFSGGGVIELDRNFGGGELGWQRNTEAFGLPVELAAGVTYDYQGEQREGFVNETGRKGAQQRDEFNAVDSQDAYLISTWQLDPRWTLTAGVRHSRVEFDSEDDYLIDGQDDSGSVRYSQTNPALGLSYQWTPAMSFYAALGQGFETPTFQELAYQPQGSGLNFDLTPSKSRNAEIGMKYRQDQTRIDLALFESRVKDEIVAGEEQQLTGRGTFANAGRSTRRGIELAVEQGFDHGISAYLAYTLLDARFDEYQRADGSDLSGRTLPGVPRHSLFAELSWQPPGTGFITALEAQSLSQRYATDDNTAEAASGYAVFNWRAAYTHAVGNWEVEPFARIDNLGDREYIGSLIVNGAGARYYEPAPDRQWLVGVGLQYQWR
ncbi:TonB-dependent receptor family protein [Halopseudomonas pelagia]|uniref:TonB-dependent receptor n=1 Tax=Halopseudomonas pelagia TaxID=553151 RepID=A0AA91U3B9_9GAMM|nr:TonB-dependent receptor [Halopseudomonas pelagia]PCC99651.1 TonB-dependent siderophore receptor [Halopseudomonas pelagia]QFY54927.1 TonB-dependent receptor [Halopseudomonas pelagia]